MPDSGAVARTQEHEEQVSIRLPKRLLDRAEKLTKTIQSDPHNFMIGITRATVLRLAIAKGLEVLERERDGDEPLPPKAPPDRPSQTAKKKRG